MNSLLSLGQNVNLHLLRLDGIEYRTLTFDNGESYVGGWKNSKPEGEGCYTWTDGSAYEGSWHAGLKHGWGTYRWPNGAAYQGEWDQGLMQGFGTFESPDGSRYQGGWQANLKHGLGTKVYANGDRYEGLWRAGKAEGPGRYVWAVRNEYDGEWRAGKMHGQGTLKWHTGERYDGEWREGQEDGIGVFTWQDGSTYEGFWVAGRKQGAGVFRPAPTKPGAAPGDAGVTAAAAAALRQGSVEGAAGGAPQGLPDVPLDSPSAGTAMLHREEFPTGDSRRGGEQLIYICDYEGGRLVHEEVLSAADVEAIYLPLQRAQPRMAQAAERRRRGGHRSYDLMLNLQLGIRYTITAGSKLGPSAPALGEEHYKEKVWIRFPREGSEVTPPHPSTDFKWKDYCPTAFRALRQLFGIDNGEYILSVCGDQALRELPSPGKSGRRGGGAQPPPRCTAVPRASVCVPSPSCHPLLPSPCLRSVFFLSHDEKFVIKTMRKEEIKLLLASRAWEGGARAGPSMVPRYVEHVRANPDTLLIRFFGVHRVKPSHGSKVRFVVMNNIFQTDAAIHRKFDLKGSTLGRTAGPHPAGSAVLKDLDLDSAFHMEPAWRGALLAQLRADLAFLEAQHVMDYSLLLGVHYRCDGYASPLVTDREDAGEEGPKGRSAGNSDAESDAGPAALAAPGASFRLSTELSLEPGRASSASSGAALSFLQSGGGEGGGGVRQMVVVDSGELEVVRSIHSLAIERASPSKLVERSKSSFGLRGISFWGQKKQQQVTPVTAQQPGPTSQPELSAQVTPRQLPSLRPTPRGHKSAAQLGSRLGMLQPLGSPGASAGGDAEDLATRAASAPVVLAPGAGDLPSPVSAGMGTPKQPPRLQNGAAEAGPSGASPVAAQLSPDGGSLPVPGPQPDLLPRRSTSPAAEAAASSAAVVLAPEVGTAPPREDVASVSERGPLISWRSDAVQLPELTLAELMACPHSPPAAPPAEAAAERAAAGAAPQQQQLEALMSARASTPLEAIFEEGSPGPSPGRSPQCLLSGAEKPPQQVEQSPNGPAASGAAVVDGRAASTPGGAADSGSGSPTSSAAAAWGAAGAGVPLPEGVPRIEAQQWPKDPLRTASSNWQRYADSLSEDALSGSREGTPASVRSATPTPATVPPVRKTASAPGQPPPAAAAAAAAPAPSGHANGPPSPAVTRSMPATWLERLVAEAATEGRAHTAAASAPPTVRADGSPASLANSTASPRPAGQSSGGWEGAATPPSRRRLPPPLARSSSEPSHAAAAAAAAAAGAADYSRITSMPTARRGASGVDLASPEAAALAARVSRTLNRPPQDRLVQDLLRLARYRILGQKASRVQQRTATTVLATRHVRGADGVPRASGGSAGAEGGEEEGPAPLAPVSPGPTGAQAAAAHHHSTEGGENQVRLGFAMPALAVGRQEPRQADEVVLFFGVIDFLQEYNMRKKLEHSFKSVVADGSAISVCDPRAYARRFLAFMEQVFLEKAPAGQVGQVAAAQQA
eukprot:scaffold19.g1758.t1